MTTKTINQESPENENRLLSSEEQAILSQIVSKEPPHSWRAQALLAIDEGATQAEAGRQARLTKGQVRYWLGKFRKERMSIFPVELLNQAQREESDSPQSSADMQDPEQAAGEEEAQPEMPDAEETAGPVDEASAQEEETARAKKKSKRKSKKKSKKAKKSKKIKKTKKVKKAKKRKKPAKKSKKKKSKKAKGARGRSSKKSKKKSKK